MTEEQPKKKDGRGGRRPGAGHPRHRPTDEQRRVVREMAGYGIPHSRMRQVVGFGEKSFIREFEEELEQGLAEANEKVAKTLFAKATSPDITGPSVTAAIFWLKARAGWIEIEKVKHEHTGKDGEEIKTSTTHTGDVNLSGPTRDQIREVARILAENGVGGDDESSGEGDRVH